MRSLAKWIEWWLVCAIGVPLGFIVAVIVYPLKRTCIFDVTHLCPGEFVNIHGTPLMRRSHRQSDATSTRR